MKTQLVMISLSLLLFTGCYTQISTVSESERRADYTKIERRLDSNTTQTDYYDNRLYSYYFRHFGNYGGFNHYDPYYSYDFRYSYFEPGYYGYDYLDYRMDMWYWNRFGYNNYPYYGPWGNGGNTIIIVNNSSTPPEPSRRNRQGRSSVNQSLISGQYYLPSVGSATSANGINSNANPNNSVPTVIRAGRSSIEFGPVIVTGSSTQGASSSTSSSSGSNTPAVQAVRTSRSSTETVVSPPLSNNTAPSQPTAQPNNNSRSSDSSSSTSGRQRQGRNGGN